MSCQFRSLRKSGAMTGDICHTTNETYARFNMIFVDIENTKNTGVCQPRFYNMAKDASFLV